MTVPPADHDAVFVEWLQLLESVNRQIHVSTNHRKVFTAVRDSVLAHYLHEDGTFINSYADVYWDSQVMVVRRLSDTSVDKPESLWWLLERIKRNAEVMTRERYLAGTDADYRSRADREFTDRYGRGLFVDRTILAELQQAMQRQLATVNEHVDRWVAHRDPRGGDQLPQVTFAVVHKALDDVIEAARFVHALLHQTDMGYSMLQLFATWKEPLRKPLFPPVPLAEWPAWKLHLADRGDSFT